MPLRSICVFGSAREGRDPLFVEMAEQTGQLLADHHIKMVYGGARSGLVGVAASACLSAGGQVVGVRAQPAAEDLACHPDLTATYRTATRGARKQLMADFADGFLVLPGGIGTLDELFEMVSGNQLGLHTKPCVLLDVNGFWTPLIGWLQEVQRAGLLTGGKSPRLLVAPSPKHALLALSGT